MWSLWKGEVVTMKLLILGGTRFLGRYLVENALERGHEVTLFNRGQFDPHVFPQVEKLTGDRDGGLDALKGRTWDAVIDTCGFYPRIVRMSAELLKDHVGHYTFISSASVYADLSQPVDESSAVATMPQDKLDEIQTGNSGPAYNEYYGALKALCEEAIDDVMPGRALHIRAGLIVGPHDYSDRFTYWPSRIAKGGHVLAPDMQGRPITVVDVRDLAEWIVRSVEARLTGVCNCSGAATTMEEILEACQIASGSDAQITYAAESFLKEQEIAPWGELPLWLPSDGPIGMYEINNDKAFASGFTARPILDTVRDTLAWDRTRPADLERKAGLDPEKEAKALHAWVSGAAH